MQAGPHCGKTLVSVEVFVDFFFFFPMKTGHTLLILVAVKHKFKLMHALMLFLKRAIYVNVGLRHFS